MIISPFSINCSILSFLILFACSPEKPKESFEQSETSITKWLRYEINESDTLSTFLYSLDYSNCNQIKNVLISMNYWDQIYRDSLHNVDKSTPDKKSKAFKYYSRKFEDIDSVNTLILKHMLPKIDISCEFTLEMYLAYFHVAIHSNDDDLKREVLPYVEKGIRVSMLEPTALKTYLNRYPKD